MVVSHHPNYESVKWSEGLGDEAVVEKAQDQQRVEQLANMENIWVNLAGILNIGLAIRSKIIILIIVKPQEQ